MGCMSLSLLLIYAILWGPEVAICQVLPPVTPTPTLLHHVIPSTVEPTAYPSVQVLFTVGTGLTIGNTLTIDVTTVPAGLPIFDTSAIKADFNVGTLPSSLTSCIASMAGITFNSLVLTLSGAGCTVAANTVAQAIIPASYLLGNPQAGTAVTWKLTTTSNTVVGNTRTYMTALLGGTAVNLAWVNPGSTVSTAAVAGALSALSVAFTPATSLTAGQQIYVNALTGTSTNNIVSSFNMFQSNPANPPSFAVGNCSASTAHAFGGTITVTLTPHHCTLRAGIPVVLDIPAAFLSSNPNAATVPAPAPPAPQPQVVGVSVSTSTDPSRAVILNGYTVGTSAIQKFVSAVPVPNANAQEALTSVAVTFVTTSALPGSGQIYLSTMPNIFRANVVSPVPVAVDGGAGCVATTTAPDARTEVDGALVVTLTPTCAITAGTTVTVTIPAQLLLRNPLAGTHVSFNVATSADAAMVTMQHGWSTVASCGTLTSLVPSYTAGATNDIASLSPTSLNNLAQSIVALSNPPYLFNAQLSCPLNASHTDGSYTTFVKVFNYDWLLPISPAGVNPIIITEWGFQFSSPMTAVVTWLPPTEASLQTLQIKPAGMQDYKLAFLFRVDRMTASGVLENGILTNGIPNRLSFLYTAAQKEVPVSSILVFNSVNAAGTPLGQVGGTWGWQNGLLHVTAPLSATFAGYYLMDVDDHHSSDDAFFGLLALLAIPVIIALVLCALGLRYFLQWRKSKTCQPAVPAMPQQLFWEQCPGTAPYLNVPAQPYF